MKATASFSRSAAARHQLSWICSSGINHGAFRQPFTKRPAPAEDVGSVALDRGIQRAARRKAPASPSCERNAGR
jgi:hypothetical protein